MRDDRSSHNNVWEFEKDLSKLQKGQKERVEYLSEEAFRKSDPAWNTHSNEAEQTWEGISNLNFKFPKSRLEINWQTGNDMKGEE